MQAMLSDGSHATAIHLSTPSPYTGCVAVEGNVWLLAKSATYVTVRNAKNGEVVSKVDILDEGVALATVGDKVWVSTAGGKIFVFSADGTLLGVLQAAGIPLVKDFFVVSDSAVFTTSGGKDIAMWDVAQFTVERTFFGRSAGEQVTCVVSANRDNSSIVSSSTTSLRLWSIDGTCLAELNEGATAVCVVQSDTESVNVWAAQSGWITVFSLPLTTRSTTFNRERTLPCAGVKQLLRTTPAHVAALDGEGLVTVWDVNTLSAIRTFKVTTTLGHGACFNALAQTTTSVSIWTVGEGKAMIWHDEFNTAASESANTSKDLQKDEIAFLRRKLKYLESMGNMYRQKIGLLFRNGSTEAGSTPSRSHHTALQFNEADQAFSAALESWNQREGDTEPLPDSHDLIPKDDAADFTEYWKRKYQEVNSELSQCKNEYDSVVGLLHSQQGSQSELEVKRAQHICQVIKEKNELKERERQLVEDVGRLRAKLRDFNTPLASHTHHEDVEGIKQQNEELRAEIFKLRQQIERDSATINDSSNAGKHNQILKSRVKKLRADLDSAQIELSEQTTAMQADISSMLDTITKLQDQAGEHQAAVYHAEKDKAQAELEVVEKQATIDRLTKLSETLELELQQRDAVEKSTQADVRDEMKMMCQSLDDRDKKIIELQTAFNDASAQLRTSTSEAREWQMRLEAKDQELSTMKQQLEHFETILNDRKNYARTVGELQGRMEMVVEELRRSFTPVQFAENVSDLESRVSNLFSLESQLRQKDDIIAMRDDELQRMKEHAKRVEEQVKQVSSVFLHLPKSVEEVELLMVEVDEYRRRLGMDAETQEMIQIRFLELQAKRKAGEKVPQLLDLASLGVGENSEQGGAPSPGKSAAEVEKLNTLTAALMGVANSINTDDKTGLVGTPAPSKSA